MRRNGSYHEHLEHRFPGTNSRERARGVNTTVQRRASSRAEENLLGYSSDRYKGESICMLPSSPTARARADSRTKTQ
jgi:hypothetical protein